ncbi:MAG: hypothetical protein AB9842_02055 [Bacteroidales bacterium]
MEINRNNYEAFLLDYFENNLSTEQVAELMVFLQANPDLNIDLEGFEFISLTPDNTLVFEDKASLKQPEIKPYSFITSENYEEQFIASVEGELSEEEEKDLEIFLGLNPDLQRDYELFGLTKLSPDTHIIYPAKSELKKGAFGVAYVSKRNWIYSTVAMAASIALLIGVFFDFSPVTPTKQFTQQQSQGSVSKHPSLDKSVSQPLNKEIIPDKPLPETKPESNPGAIAALSAGNIKNTDVSVVKPDITGVDPLPGLEIAHIRVASDDPSQLAGISRSYFTELYGYIQLREQREYQEYLDARLARPWYAKALTEVKTLVAGPDIYDPKGVRRDNDIWMLAEAGIKGINYLTKSDLKLKRQLDEDGRTSAYAVASNRFEYADKVGK